MKKLIAFAVIAIAALAFTAAPALAGPRHGHATGRKHSHSGTWGTRYYYPPVYRPRVVAPPIVIPPHRHGLHHHPYQNHHVPSWHGIYGRGAGYNGGVGVHAGGFGLHIRF